MTPIELTNRMLALANAMDGLAIELLEHDAGYETRILRHQLAQSASALRSKQVVGSHRNPGSSPASSSRGWAVGRGD